MLIATVLLAIQVAAPPDSVVRAVQAVLRPFADTSAARAAGFVPLAIGRFQDGTPFQGIHWIHLRRLRQGSTGLSEPTFLLYAPVGNDLRLVGAAYGERIGHEDEAPAGIGAAPAEWHLHQACFAIPGIGFTLADGVDDCRELGGIPGPRQTAMVHVWAGLPSPEGPFSHDNVALPFVALGLAPPSAADMEDHERGMEWRALAVALADSYGFRLPFVKRLDITEARSPLQDSVAVHREAIRRLAIDLRAADARKDEAASASLRSGIRAHGDFLHALYDRIAPTPEVRNRLDAQFAQSAGGHHRH
ncbi:MAG: hypothetical protein EXR93_11845 [Gemmatimonadetes bacterium]|nr:hypothetical protein [Gemmatimonadota bacterium]